MNIRYPIYEGVYRILTNDGNDFYDVMINTNGISFLKNNVVTKSYPNK